MTPEDLHQLREVFRHRFTEVDFCIGEGEVERLFRELLGEPEPESQVTCSSSDNLGLLKTELDKLSEKAKGLFERDEAFYRAIDRNR